MPEIIGLSVEGHVYREQLRAEIAEEKIKKTVRFLCVAITVSLITSVTALHLTVHNHLHRETKETTNEIIAITNATQPTLPKP